MARVLIIDDDQAICRVLSNKISRLGHDVQVAHTLKQGLESSKSAEHDVVYLDVRLPDGNGLDSLHRFNHCPGAPEVIITGESDPDGAEQAIRSGAWDFIQKPASLKSMVFPLIRALQHRERKKTVAPRKILRHEGIIGSSSRMRGCLDLLAQIADTDLSVLITGETGTGKELFARSIHANSLRAKAPFVTVDCASLPENLVESELFGSIKGAFTGASAAREGLIIQANGGTLFLDEVGEMPLATQKKFLRVLQERRFRQVGGTKELTSNFRLICATNRNLEEMVAEEAFRQDLLYRVQAMHIELPPLRERRDDIKALAIHRMQMLCEQFRVPTKGMSPELLESLEGYDWPGNVRELFNLLENILFTTRDEGVLYPEHLPMNLRIKMKQAQLRKAQEEGGLQGLGEAGDLDDTLTAVPHAAAPDSGPTFPDQPSSPMEPGQTAPTWRAEGHLPPGDFGTDLVARLANQSDESFPTLRDVREKTVGAMEKCYLNELLARSGADLPTALHLSGLSRARFYELLKKHSVSFR